MKKMSKVVTVMGVGVVGVVAAKVIENIIWLKKEKDKEAKKKKAIDEAKDASNEAFYHFKMLNGLGCDAFEKVSKLGITPVYSYNSKELKLEEMKIPKKYTLLKSMPPSGKYALVQIANDKVFSYCRIHVYFVDAGISD